MKVSSILNIEDPTQYKVHLASWNGEKRPLDVFVRDRKEWEGWNSWRASKDDFNRKYIFSLIEFHPDPGAWLFGGIWEVHSRSGINNARSYEISLTNQASDLIGRLKIGFSRSGRAKALKLENCFDNFTLDEILKTSFTGQAFPGYENITLSFLDLEHIIRTNKADWRAALLYVKGIYVIFDTSNGLKYVGSAYGGAGVWSRWSAYVETGHGHNDELTKLIDQHGMAYARQNFCISLLEYRPVRTDDQTIIDRECYWKEVLLSRAPYGYNKN